MRLKCIQNWGRACLKKYIVKRWAYELNKFGLVAEQEVAVPVYYEEIKFDCGYRIDILVNRCQVAQGLDLYEIFEL